MQIYFIDLQTKISYVPIDCILKFTHDTSGFVTLEKKPCVQEGWVDAETGGENVLRKHQHFYF